MKCFFRRGVAAAVAGAALGLCGAPARADVGVGQKASDFTLPGLTGKVTLGAHLGKVVVLDFWASWCEPCRRELPELVKLQNAYRERGVVFVGVNLDERRDAAEKLAHDLGLAAFAAVGLDPGGAHVASRYEPPKMPTSYVIDRSGTVRFVNAGFDGKDDLARLRKELDELTRK